MADAAAFRTYLRDVIGVADPQARREAIQEEGLNTLEDLIEFDSDGIKALCGSVRKPGGTIENPAYVAGGDQPEQIPNPGFAIPAICESRLKIAVYAAKIYDMIGRDLTQAALNRARLRLWENHRQLVEEHEDPEQLPSVSKTFGIVKAMDLVPNHLRDRLGVRKVALSYVIRETVDNGPIPAQADDSATSDGYDSIMDELIDFTPHTGDSYKSDNAKVYQILQDMVQGTSFESSIKSYQRTRNGRSAYLALCQHNLGSSKWDKIIEDAENYVMKREWNGKNHRFTLRAHVSRHREAHNEMARASQYVSYELPNDHTRVGRLLKSITTKEPAIVAAITHIQGTPAQRGDFEEAADFLLLTAPAPSSQRPDHRISGVNSNEKKKGDKIGPKTGVEVRYYTRKEYSKLSHDERKELAELRGKTDKGNKNSNTTAISAMQQQFKELEERLIAAVSTAQQGQTDSTSDDRPDPLRNPLTQRGQS